MTNKVIVERLDTLIKQNKADHGIIFKKQDLTNGAVKLNTKWRYSFVSAGIIVTTAVIPLIIYIAWSFDGKIEDTNRAVQQLAEK